MDALQFVDDSRNGSMQTGRSDATARGESLPLPLNLIALIISNVRTITCHHHTMADLLES